MPTRDRVAWRCRRWGAVALCGALAMPPVILFSSSSRASDVRLATVLTPAGPAAPGTGLRVYDVEVRTSGGVARRVTLKLIAQSPLDWGAYPAECVVRRAGNRLWCSLGDVAGSRRLRVGVRIPAAMRATRAPRIVAVADAANVTRESALAVQLPTAPTNPPPGPGSPSGAPDPSSAPSHEPTKSGNDSPFEGPLAAGKPVPTWTRSASPGTPPRKAVAPSRKPSRRPSESRPEGPSSPITPPEPRPVPPAAPSYPAAPVPQPPAQQTPGPETTSRPDMRTPVVLPPISAPAPAGAAPPTPGAVARPDAAQTSLISRSGSKESEDPPWSLILGLVLVGVIALLWAVVCQGVLRRRRIAQ